MVVSARIEASKIGADILKKGGNAFDAMMATEMALAVAILMQEILVVVDLWFIDNLMEKLVVLDYREKAPIGSHKKHVFGCRRKCHANKSTLGAIAVGVPGTIAGIFEVHEKFGNLPMKDILEPVIALANKGFVVTENQANRLNNYQDKFRLVNKDSILFYKDLERK